MVGSHETAAQTTSAADRSDRARVLRYIDENLSDPQLGPRTAAAALGWSLRRLHAEMAGCGTSFMRQVRQRRLCEARRSLRQGETPVLQVAMRCGFDSLATFYRQYVAAFGVPPGADRDRPPHPPECGCPTGFCTA